MQWKRRGMALALAAALLPLSAARASDHRDGSAVTADPSTDLNDVYSWTSADGTKVYLLMTLFPAADKSLSKFSNVAYYVFHTTSRASFAAASSTALDVICSFNAAQIASCWVGSSAFVYGDASNPAGVSSTDGKVKLFAGPRKDHFFFNLNGFNDVRSTISNRAMPVTFDANGCAAASGTNAGGLTTSETASITNKLKKTMAGTMPPSDFFAGLNTVALVMEIDKTLLTGGGPILSIWAATHKKM